ncbi:MAG: CBS domain-containing protein [Thermodesulfobacteriota bacterium]|nr:CBS domain-containing protein [Thermodesulfobacteriota bacterium]
MKARKVKEIMIPLSEYATVSEEATLYDAVKSLYNAQNNFEKEQYRHRAILVYDKNNRITGKISAIDIVRAIEPKYRQFEQSDQNRDIGLSRFGLSSAFLNSLVKQYDLWDEKIEKLIAKAEKQKVRDIMYTPYEGEFVQEDSSLAEAIHQLLIGHHQSLLVLQKNQITGILRLTDIFKNICDLLLATK